MSRLQRFWIGYTTLQDFLHVKVLKTTIVLTITNLLAFEELIDLHYEIQHSAFQIRLQKGITEGKSAQATSHGLSEHQKSEW